LIGNVVADEKEDEKKKEGKPEGDAEAGAEGAAAEGEEGAEGEGKKKKGKLKILIIAVVVVIVIAVPAVLYLTGVIGGKKGEVNEHVTPKEGEPVVGPDGVVEHSVYYDLEEFIVNLNVGSKRPSFLKMTVSLELGGESQVPRVEEKMPRIRDSFQVYLRELRQEDLQGSSGLYRLREELLLRVNKIVYPAKVNDILFKEILVQ
jgi:flagellar FliL protein